MEQQSQTGQHRRGNRLYPEHRPDRRDVYAGSDSGAGECGVVFRFRHLCRSGGTCPETGQGLLDAPELKRNTVCDGQLAVNDTANYYRLDIPASGRLDLSCSAEMPWLELALYDENESVLWRGGV